MAMLVRRLTKRDSDGPGHNEFATKLVKSLHKSLDAYTVSKTPEKLADISKKVDAVWRNVLDINKATAPQKKLDLAEEILLRPDVLKLLLVVFRLVQLDVKRKIRDLYLFVMKWCSNDAPESSVPRTRSKTKINPKIRDQLFYCREEITAIIEEGYDEPGSIRFYNDIIREFAQDDVCLKSILDVGTVRKPDGCTWKVFKRLEMKSYKTHFEALDLIAGTYDALEIILLQEHAIINEFLDKFFDQFCFVTRNLIDSPNFYVKARGLRLLYRLLNAKGNENMRWKFLCHPTYVRSVLFSLRSKSPVLRNEAVPFLDMITDFDFNPTPVHLFIQWNIPALIKYCFKYAPHHFYDGNRKEYDDSRLAKIAQKVYRFGNTAPLLPDERAEFDEAEKMFAQFREEQTVATSFQDFINDLPTTRHDFNVRRPLVTTLYREKMIFGQAPTPSAPPNTASSASEGSVGEDPPNASIGTVSDF